MPIFFSDSSWLTAFRIILLRDHALQPPPPPLPLAGAGGGARGEAGLGVLAVVTDGEDGMVMDSGDMKPESSSFCELDDAEDGALLLGVDAGASSLLIISTSLLVPSL
jgi:hypothetical protein